MGLQNDKKAAALLVVVFGLAAMFSAGVTASVAADHRMTDVQAFESHVANEVRIVDRALERAVVASESTRSLFAVQGEVSRADFALFTAPQLVAHSEIQALSWVPKVSGDQREAFESTIKQGGYPDFAVVERGSGGDLVRAGDRALYYPVLFIEPLQGNEAAFGFDLGSNEIRLEALLRARDTGEFVVTQRIELVQEQEHGYGFLGVVADYGSGPIPDTEQERRSRHRGFVTSVFRAADVLGRSIPTAASPMSVALIDLSAPLGEQVMYQERPLADFGAAEHIIKKDYTVGGRDWQMLFTPATGISSQWARWEALAAGIGAFLLVLATGGFLTLLVRRNREIRSAVDSRTSELRNARNELRLSAQQNQAILDGAGAGIVAVNDRMVVTLVNPAAVTILGATAPDQMLGKTLEEIYQNGLGRSEANGWAGSWVVARALREERTIEEPLVNGVRPDGKVLPLGVVAAPLRDESGKVVGAVSIFRDVSERVRVDRAKDEFLAMTGHELRTPLTAIHASLGLAASGALGEIPQALQGPLDNAKRNSERLVKLVNDIIALETMSLGETEFVLRPTQALDVVRNVVELNSMLSAEHGVCVEISGVGFATALDRDRMTQALINLLQNAQNALKFSDEGGTVTLAAYEENGRGVFEVSDAGKGIPHDKLNDIFGRFEQVDSSDSRLYGGVGLGLAITKAIAERHGGEVWVDDSSVAGTTFKLAVPLISEPAS